MTMPAGLKVRVAGPDDMPALLRLFRGFMDYLGDPSPPDDELAGAIGPVFVDPQAEILIGEEDGEPVAYAHVRYHHSVWMAGPECFLEDLFVFEQQRDGGIGRRMLGVIFDPCRDDMFIAQRGRGATRNGEAISVAETSTLRSALITTQVQSDDPAMLDNYVTRVRALAGQSRAVRALGTPALSLAYIVWFVAVPLYALVPLVILFGLARRGAPVDGRLTGACAGLASAGLATVAYSLHCPDDAAPFLHRRLGGADVHPAVYLHRVDRQDFTAEPGGDVDGQLGLPGGGRAHEGNDAGQPGAPTR